MDVRLAGILLFPGFGGILLLWSILMAARAKTFQQSAMRTAGTVIEAGTEAIKSRPMESFYREGEARRQVQAKSVHAHRTRWLKVEYQDASGNRREATRIVAGRYSPGQRVELLYPPNDPANIRIDSILESYGNAFVIGGMGMLFVLIGAAVLANVIPVAPP